MYSSFANKFSETRAKENKWNLVKEFLKDVKPENSLLDLGCGNGRNYVVSNYTGVDECKELCDLAVKNIRSFARYTVHTCEPCKTVEPCEITCENIVTFETNQKFDYVICVAVLHHILNESDRRTVLRKILSFLKPNGKALITWWIPNELSKSSYVKKNLSLLKRGSIHNIPFQGKQRLYYIFKENELVNEVKTTRNFTRNFTFGQELDNEYLIIH